MSAYPAGVTGFEPEIAGPLAEVESVLVCIPCTIIREALAVANGEDVDTDVCHVVTVCDWGDQVTAYCDRTGESWELRGER